MYLSTITDKDISSKRKVFIRAGGSNLATSDIEGSKPSLPGYQYLNKPSFSNKTSDIEKSSPRQLHQHLDKPQYSLSTKDIDKAFPSKVGFQTKRIGTNPLNPVYKLPDYEIRPFTPPKFIRDHTNISDIEGTKPEIYYKWKTRDGINVHDIQGAKPRPEKNITKADLMDPRDINRGESHTYTRLTNPLMPEYLCRDETGAVVSIGHVQGSLPKKMVNTASIPHNRHLDNRDIEGSTPGTVGLGTVGKRERNYVKKIVDSADIEGAQSGSLKKGITTVRITNPLEPKYIWKTEDTPPPEPANFNDKTKEMEKMDPKYSKSLARFWGVTPAQSETKSPPRSKLSSRKSDFHRNANRFFAPDALTAETMDKDLRKNTEKFYDNSPNARIGVNYFETLENKGSIHRPKPKSNFIDVESAEYQKNVGKFFYASSSRPSSNGAKSEGNEFAYAASQFSRKSPPVTPPLEKISEAGYKFQLSRAEIAKPDKNLPIGSDHNPRRNTSTPQNPPNSNQNLFAAAAKKLFA